MMGSGGMMGQGMTGPGMMGPGGMITASAEGLRVGMAKKVSAADAVSPGLLPGR